MQAEKDSVGSAVVALEALRMPDAGTPVAELCSEGLDTLDAQMLTPPACSDPPGDALFGMRRPKPTRLLHVGLMAQTPVSPTAVPSQQTPCPISTCIRNPVCLTGCAPERGCIPRQG